MNKWLVAIAFSILLLGPVLIQNVFADPPPPQMRFSTFQNGCKVFTITDTKDRISGITVIGDTDEIDPPTSFFSGEHDDMRDSLGQRIWEFEYENNPLEDLITVCPKDEKFIDFAIIAFDGQKEKLSNTLRIEELQLTADRDKKFDSSFIIGKKFDEKNCKKAIESLETENVETVTAKCKKLGNITTIEVTGTVKDKDKPALFLIQYDPPTEVFLLVGEVCAISDVDGSLICPVNFEVDYAIDFPDDVVGGKLIPIETTSLLLSSAQTFSWMIPLVLSGIGIGLFLFTRKSENSKF